MRIGVDLITGNRASSDTAAFAGSRYGTARDFSGTANVQFAHHPNYAIIGPLTIIAFIERDAATDYCEIISKNSTITTHVPYSWRLGDSTTGSDTSFLRANAFYDIYYGNGASLHLTGEKEVIGLKIADASIDTIPRVMHGRGQFTTLTLKASFGSGDCTDDGASSVYIGRRSDGVAQLDGRIYWIALWQRELTDREMFSFYLNPWQLFEPDPLTVFWPKAAAAAGITGPLIGSSHLLTNGPLINGRLAA